MVTSFQETFVLLRKLKFSIAVQNKSNLQNEIKPHQFCWELYHMCSNPEQHYQIDKVYLCESHLQKYAQRRHTV